MSHLPDPDAKWLRDLSPTIGPHEWLAVQLRWDRIAARLEYDNDLREKHRETIDRLKEELDTALESVFECERLREESARIDTACRSAALNVVLPPPPGDITESIPDLVQALVVELERLREDNRKLTELVEHDKRMREP